jgi:hypothetical protein
MNQSLSEKRWAENEVIFRQANERVTKELAAVKTLAEEDGQQDLVKGIDDITLHFYCECADDKCHERVPLTPKEYTQQHHNKSRFILIPGHQIPSIERVVFEDDNYIVVEKYMTPPDKVEKLNHTKF